MISFVPRKVHTFSEVKKVKINIVFFFPLEAICCYLNQCWILNLHTVLRKFRRWLGPAVTDFFFILKVSLEAEGKPWLVPHSGSERGPSEDNYVNSHMKIRHHGQSGFAGSAGKESRSLQSLYSFPLRCFPWQGKAWKHISHLLRRWPSNWISLGNVSDTVENNPCGCKAPYTCCRGIVFSPVRI